jgi:hypothetical protein
LQHSTSTSTHTYAAPSGSSAAKVIIILGNITLASSGTLTLTNGSDVYYVTVEVGSGARKIELNNIPSSFLTSFYITNTLGITLASSGNSLSILPL